MTGKRNFPVVAIIFNDKNQVLLSQRHDLEKPHAHQMWQLPGGGIEFGEDPKDTAIRETREEVGIEIELLTKHPFVVSCMFPKQNIHAIILGYLATYKSGEIDTSKDQHTYTAKWINPDDIDYSKCLPGMKELIAQAEEYRKTMA